MENIVHLFWDCTFVSRFWNNFQQEFGNKLNVVTDLNIVLFGTKNELISTLIFMGKRYIYGCRLDGKPPIMETFKMKLDIMNIMKLEFHIAKNNNRIDNWQKKWESLMET